LNPADIHLWITILAGGSGTRFWPLSTPGRPKQLLPLAGDLPLIHDTMERARGMVAEERIRILAGDHLAPLYRQVLPDLPDTAFMLEPRAKGTGPVLAWAAWVLSQEDPDAVLISLHSDHAIRPVESFHRLLLDAARIAVEEDVLLTVAVEPDRPETGYGYLQPGEPLTHDQGQEAFRVAAFHEKPDKETAGEYMLQGYFWNSGIFVWTASRFLSEIRRWAPEIGDLLHHLENDDPQRFFDEVPTVTVDESVLERSDRVGTIKATFQWDDVGNWEALSRTREADADGNVSVGQVIVVNGEGNIAVGDDAPVVLFGVNDLVVVRTGDVTLVTHRSHAPELKRLLAELPPKLRDLGN